MRLLDYTENEIGNTSAEQRVFEDILIDFYLTKGTYDVRFIRKLWRDNFYNITKRKKRGKT